MKKIILISAVVFGLTTAVSAQVKIGHNAAAGVYNQAAHLELANDLTAPANTWRSLVIAYVDFTRSSFTDSSTWGIAGTQTPGLIVYNSGNRVTGGFDGAGLYLWNGTAWVRINEN